MKRFLGLLPAVALSVLPGIRVAAQAPAAPAAAPSDPKAVAVADKVMDSLGGKDAWNKTHYLRFDFAVDREGKTLVSRAHTWDKWTGRYRLEGKTKEGDPTVVLMNLNTKEGTAYKKGQKLEGEEAKKAVDDAYATWVNDTYWLLMPYKMKDPGVILTMAGEEKKGDEAWDKVRLSFDNVGLTPKDQYWAYVNRKTGLVDRWDFVLKGEKKPPSEFEWKNWKKIGAIMLADDRVSPKDGTRIYFPVLSVPDNVPDSVFTTP
jgi:hypothetical protein